MPRTSLVAAVTAKPAAWSTTGTVVTMTAIDTGNGNSVPATGNDFLIVQNSGGSPYTFTLTSVADPQGRTGDVAAASMAAGEVRIFGPLPSMGWQQSDGALYFTANNAAIKVGIIRM